MANVKRYVAPDSVARFVSWSQGLYFTLTGFWPLVDVQSFQTVTGPKTDHLVTGRESDHWLVNTVAVLVVAIGITLLAAAWRRRVSAEIALLGAASALALTAIDVVYVSRQTISSIYLADAAVEVIFIAGWIYSTMPFDRGK